MGDTSVSPVMRGMHQIDVHTQSRLSTVPQANETANSSKRGARKLTKVSTILDNRGRANYPRQFKLSLQSTQTNPVAPQTHTARYNLVLVSRCEHLITTLLPDRYPRHVSQLWRNLRLLQLRAQIESTVSHVLVAPQVVKLRYLYLVQCAGLYLRWSWCSDYLVAALVAP